MTDRLVVLTPAQIELLTDTLDLYEAARLGQLNATADELQRVCKLLGWQGPLAVGGVKPLGYLPWARRVLGRETP